MNKFSHYISEDNIRKIVSLKSGKTAVIPKNGRNEEEAPGILLFDNSLNLLAILDRNELFDGARLNVIELSDGRILTYGRSYYIKLWTSSGEFIEKWNNHFFTRGTIQLSGRRIVSTCGTSIVIREENGRNIKTVNASKSGWLPLRVLKNLSEDRFFTDDL
nr:hypothetical protein [bacterium]